MFCAATAIALPAQTFTTLHSFDGTDGSRPQATLVQGANGKFYGTTFGGGAHGDGTVFSITPSGILTTLYSFCAQTNCADGENSVAGLVQDVNGKFYGTTRFGGANGDGTVFSITAGGTLTTLHSFDGTDGENPAAVLIQTSNGKFYGTTNAGGTSNACGFGCGTVFSITAGGTLATLHSFDTTDGEFPSAPLVLGADGKFYGTTNVGGPNGGGTVFNITAGGMLTTLYNFSGADGANPYAGLAQGANGIFYGTTSQGGANNLCSPNSGCGTVFSITVAGALTTLHNFDGTDGEFPIATLIQGTNGTFYGTTGAGGANSDGTVFSLSVGLGPFVETQPTSAAVGATVKILGADLTGSTSVTFNGTAATFTVKSKSEITTTVPTGATTGEVRVVTPGGTLFSNVPFRVLP